MRRTVLKTLTAERLNSLSPQLRKAARFVVEHPEDVATRSQRQVAATANLSAPTLTRLAQAAGYDSYDALREECRDEILSHRTMLSDKARAMLVSEDGTMGFAAEHAAATTRNIGAFIENLDHDSLEEAAEQLSGARKVTLIGAMSARPIVDYARYLANMSLNGWSVLGRDGDALAADLAGMGVEDTCIVCSFAPYAARAVELSMHVERCGVPVIAVTDNRLSPVAAKARHSFLIGTESPQFFPSHVAAMVFFETIVGMVIRKRGDTARKRVAAIERQNHEIGEYWQD